MVRRGIKYSHVRDKINTESISPGFDVLLLGKICPEAYLKNIEDPFTGV